MSEQKVFAPPTGAGNQDDPRYADKAKRPKRTEKAIAFCFLVSLIAMVALVVGTWQSYTELELGAILGTVFMAMGIGVIAWGKYLMPQGPFAEERHEMVSPEVEIQATAESFSRGADAIKRRSFLGKFFILINVVMGVVLIVPLRSLLGKDQPGSELFHTPFKPGMRLVTLDGNPVNTNTNGLDVGGVTTVFPEGYVGSATGQTLLIRVDLSDYKIQGKPERDTWSPNGYIAFSKVCTHAGCPVGLYEQEFKQLLCPCHQSVFEIQTGGTEIFGPAPRPLPQLPLMIDSDGFIRAQRDFLEPVGPGFWLRGGTWHGYA